jgi:hypothetical protein
MLSPTTRQGFYFAVTRELATEHLGKCRPKPIVRHAGLPCRLQTLARDLTSQAVNDLLALVDTTTASGMPKVAILMMSVIGFAMVCVALDRALAGRVALLRIFVSWLVPLLGSIVTIRVAAEESQQDLRSRWLLWPLRPLLCEAAPPGFAKVTDMRVDAVHMQP